MAPQVRDLQALIAEQTASLKPQYDLIENDIVGNATAGAAQEAGLGARKDKAFKQIGQSSQDKGMFFSGFTPNEEAEYTAGTYLPALAQLQATIASTRSNLLGKKAELGKSAFDTATNIREQDISTKNSWDAAERQRAFQAEQDRISREATAAENEKNRRADAANSARGAAASAGPSNQELFASELAKSAGNDGKVSPGTYNALKQQWVASGYGDYKSFHDKYWKFANDSHWWNYR